jgi:Tfp pilus assembly protein PilF
MRNAGGPDSQESKARPYLAVAHPGNPWRRLLPLALWLVYGLTGCETTSLDRARLFNDDGVYLFDRGDYGAARESFEVALQFQPKDPGLLYNVGQCYDRQSSTAKAEEYYRRCLAEDANHAACRHALAVLLFRTGRRTDADHMIEDWLTREPERADAYVEDGWRLRQDGDLTQAQARLQQALALDPHHVRALTEMALLYEVMEHPERAAVLYARVLDEDPKQSAVVDRLNLLRAKKVGKPLPD